MQIIKKIISLLSSYERKRAFLLLLLILIMAFLEMIGVASILPFVTVLTNPSVIETNIVLNNIYKVSSTFGIENHQQFLFALGILVFALLILSLTFKALTNYLQIRFIQMLQFNISKRLLERYLSQKYSWFLNRNSADFSKNILVETGIVVGNGVSTLLDLIAKSAVSFALLALLILANPKIAFIVGFCLGSSYLLIYWATKTYISRLGKERFKKNQLVFKSINEAFGAIKEIKMGGLEKIYIKMFSDPAQTIAKNIASSSVVQQLPRFILEAIAFGGIMILILFQMKQTGSFNNALPFISLYAFAGYRLMPALQQIYGTFSKFDFIIPSVNNIHNELLRLKVINLNDDQSKLLFRKKIDLKNIYFNYPNSSRTVLKNINISITANSTIGFMGATGSGKTTTVDIILGVLEPQKGSLEVDGNVITNHNSRSWQKNIGYVPQFIYLSDNSILSNIAFGLEPNEIDGDAVVKAAKIANLHEFIVDELPDKYQTIVGERGIRLSGGQRQRIGIARALYHSPRVLILDEATNSLDKYTEQAVMEAVNKLGKKMTIILIAHRLNTLKKCDKIYMFDKGEIKSECSYEEMIKLRENFDIKDKMKKSV